jgi:hypothetical protein
MKYCPDGHVNRAGTYFATPAYIDNKTTAYCVYFKYCPSAYTVTTNSIVKTYLTSARVPNVTVGTTTWACTTKPTRFPTSFPTKRPTNPPPPTRQPTPAGA